MAGLFAILVAIILLTMGGWHRSAVALFCINLVLSLLMLWHHMTETIPINF